jgi:hypothetical protein
VKKAALLALALCLSAAALLFTRLWLYRASLPYNGQGRHFDAAHSVTYDDGAVLVYGLLALVFALPAMLTIFLAARAWRR